MDMILLRHTRPRGAEGLCYGRLDLPPDDGFAATSRDLVAALPPLRRVVTSPLQRCAALAERIARARGLTAQPDPRLREMDFGNWEGQPWAALPRAELDEWAADLLGARPHGGESVADLRARALAALRAHAAPGVLVVTHHGVIKCARQQRDGDAAWQSTLAFGDWLPFDPALFAA